MRSEEEMTKDMILHEKRYRAKEILETVKAWKRKAVVTTAICAAVLFAVLISFIMGAYDAQNILLMVALIAAYFVLLLISYYIAGSAFAHGFSAFSKGTKLLSRWNDAVADFEAMEEKVAERTAMPGAMEKCEIKLINVADDIASYAEKTVCK